MKSMGDRYLNVYDALLPPAFKADVWRYSVVYHYGGCYTDAGSITTRPLIEMLKPTD
jgi:mannosyltransferase OCH1-like enzyme